jgi:hypothetical protein
MRIFVLSTYLSFSLSDTTVYIRNSACRRDDPWSRLLPGLDLEREIDVLDALQLINEWPDEGLAYQAS